MGELHSVSLQVGDVTKNISVFCDDITRFDRRIDVLTTSAFVRDYAPVPRTVFHALSQHGIDVSRLAQTPAFDLRDPCNVWLSEEICNSDINIGRIGCIELINFFSRKADPYAMEQAMIHSIQAYFYMLDIASVYGADITAVALPLLGSGSQRISANLLLIPLINECITFLERNKAVRHIYFVEKNPEKAQQIADCLKNSLRFAADTQPQETNTRKLAFISYSSKDKNIADNLCAKLELHGIKVWYAPRDTDGPYAGAIVGAIDRSNYFIPILSQNSIASEHVLNEIDLAFQNIPQGMKFKPLRIDDALFTPSLKYYLSRQHWMDATVPPLEERLNEFTRSLLKDASE